MEGVCKCGTGDRGMFSDLTQTMLKPKTRSVIGLSSLGCIYAFMSQFRAGQPYAEWKDITDMGNSWEDARLTEIYEAFMQSR